MSGSPQLHRSRAATLFAVLAFFAVALPAHRAGASVATGGTVDAAGDSVAKIFSRSKDGVGEGSGFIVASDRVLTNAHVLQGATEATVRFPEGPSESCTVVNVSAAVDLATLGCETGDRRALRFASAVRNGETVVAIGYPNAGAERVTHGAITDAAPNSVGYLATDAALDPGNSGGPVVATASGEVVGVATAIDRQDRAANFAIPASTARRYLVDASSGRPEVSKGGGNSSGRWWVLVGAAVIIFAAGFFLGRLRRATRHRASSRAAQDGDDLRIAVRDPNDASRETDLDVVLVGAPRGLTESAEADDDATEVRNE